MDKKNIKLILVFIAIFLISNGTFIALCEKDVILDCINRIGNWSTAALWHSSYIFGFYKLADYAYNIDYVLPKVANSLFVIKYVDKLNGWLGFSSKGELEQYLASHSYNPLYKDAASSFYSYIGLPFYNYWYAPLFGVKPIKQEGPLFMQEPVVLEIGKHIKTTITNTRYNYVDKHDQDILRLNESLERLTSALHQDTLAHLNKKARKELLDELSSIRTLEDIPTYTSEQLKETFIEYKFTHRKYNDTNDFMPLRVQFIQFFKDLDTVKIKYDLGSFSENYVIMSSRNFAETYPTIFEVGFHKANGGSPRSNIYFCPGYTETVHLGLFSRYKFSPEISLFQEMDVHYHFNAKFALERGNDMVSVITTNALDALEGYQLSTGELLHTDILTLQEDIRSRFIDARMHNPQDILEETVPVLNLDETNNTQTPLPVDESTTLTEEAVLPAVSIGALTTLSVSQALVVFSYFFGIETFQTLIQTNSHVQESLINLYTLNNMELPPLISDAINNSPMAANGSTVVDSNSPLMGPLNNGNPTPLQYVGYGIVFLGAIGLTWYLTKYGMDASPVVESAKTFKESLQDKYVNFK